MLFAGTCKMAAELESALIAEYRGYFGLATQTYIKSLMGFKLEGGLRVAKGPMTTPIQTLRSPRGTWADHRPLFSFPGKHNYVGAP